MKILLIRPKPHRETIGLQHVMICEPLELEYLVSNMDENLSEKVQIKIIDLILEKKRYSQIINEEKPDLILYTGYITQVGVIKELVKTAKEIFPSVKIGVGGVHAEVLPDDFSSSFIDFIYSANGIDGFNITLQALIAGESDDCIRKRLLNMGPKKNYFSYKFPDRDSVSNYRKKYSYMFHNPCALIKTSYGCPYNCSFCFCKEITDKKYFTRDIQDIMDELEQISEEEIYIVDDDFLYDVGRLKDFISEIKRRGINKKFLVYGRADFIVANKDVLKALKSIGLQLVIVGIESLRNKDLKEYNKKTTKDINELCIKMLKHLDIELYATLIIPLDFSSKDFKNMTNWLRNLDVRFVNLQPLTPLPGTDIFDKYSKELIVKREDYHLWDLAHIVLRPKYMTIRRFYLELLISYYKVVMRPKHVLLLIKKHGWKSSFKMLVGSTFVSVQYMKKIVRGY